MQRLLSASALLVGLVVAVPARADVSSWLSVSAGAASVRQTEGLERETPATLDLLAGMGTSPARALAAGFVLRTQTHFGLGTDLSAGLRGATQGFVNGEWGLALDVGPYLRNWGTESSGYWADVVLGVPWALQLTVGGSTGSDGAQGLFASFGVDLARFTVYRRSGQSWHPNPLPAYRPGE